MIINKYSTCLTFSCIGPTSAITPAIFVAVVAAFVGVVAVLVLMIICVFAMFKKQKEKNKVLESGIKISNKSM